MDVHVPRAITVALRMQSIYILTAQEDGAAMLDDDQLLDRALNSAACWCPRTRTCCAKEC
jgi:hypothetical protein